MILKTVFGVLLFFCLAWIFFGVALCDAGPGTCGGIYDSIPFVLGAISLFGVLGAYDSFLKKYTSAPTPKYLEALYALILFVFIGVLIWVFQSPEVWKR